MESRILTYVFTCIQACVQIPRFYPREMMPVLFIPIFLCYVGYDSWSSNETTTVILPTGIELFYYLHNNSIPNWKDGNWSKDFCQYK